MKASSLPILAAVSLCGLQAGFAATAQMEMSNEQIRMSSGPCSCGFGLTWYIHFSTFYTENPLTADGGFIKQPTGSATTHKSYMLYEDPSTVVAANLVEVNLPLGDFDGNGVADLFEDGPEIATATTGTYYLDWGPGTLSFTWNRPAGSAIGTCDLYMQDQILGRLGPFRHTFQRTNSTGSIEYQRTQSMRSGTISLDLDSQTHITGPVTFVRDSSDPYKKLILVAGTWKNGDADMTYENATLTRDAARPSLYRGVLKWSSGEKSSHLFSLVDPNDADGDGIPDLSDDVPSVIGTQKNGTAIELIINGEAGHTYEVQMSTSLNAPTWERFTTVTLTNAQHAVPLSAPSTGAKFWRVKKQ